MIYSQMLTDSIDGVLLQGFYLIPLLLQIHVAIEHFETYLQTFFNLTLLVIVVRFRLIDFISSVVRVLSLLGPQLQNHHDLGWVLDHQNLMSLQVTHPILE